MPDIMMFPDTVEEFMESYKLVDVEHVYSNGVEFVPIYRMMQWFQHRPERKTGKWIRGDAEKLTGSQRCSICHKACYKGKDYFNYCPNCGADMRGDKHETN